MKSLYSRMLLVRIQHSILCGPTLRRDMMAINTAQGQPLQACVCGTTGYFAWVLSFSSFCSTERHRWDCRRLDHLRECSLLRPFQFQKDNNEANDWWCQNYSSSILLSFGCEHHSLAFGTARMHQRQKFCITNTRLERTLKTFWHDKDENHANDERSCMRNGYSSFTS